MAIATVNRGIPVVSGIVFSLENWNRTPESVKELFGLAFPTLILDIALLNDHDLRLMWLGKEEGLGDTLLEAIRMAEDATSSNRRGLVCLCLNYSGHDELAAACQQLERDGVSPNEVTQAEISKRIYRPEVPPLDLVIRTGGERHISDFMLWRSSDAELYFTEKLWPDVTESDLELALDQFAKSRSERP
jgi:undecaprenyl diphosphate synthase